MPEGDTLARIATVLREVLAGRRVTAARGGPGGASLERVIGDEVVAVRARGKHLLISFAGGLTLHTHLGLHGSWHRYRTGEPWRRAASRAVAVLEVPGAVCVCFDAPTVELIETRALAIHPRLSRLGPELLADGFDVGDALARLRAPRLAGTTIGDALLDQRALAGLGNVYRSELCFMERLDPFTPVEAVGDAVLHRLVERGAILLAANSRGGTRVTTGPGAGGPLYVYGRTGRPCRRCGTLVRSEISTRVRAHAGALVAAPDGAMVGAPDGARVGAPAGPRVTEGAPRRVYWCPRCQPQYAAPR